MKYRESISKDTEQEVRSFLAKHQAHELSYWDWRESNELALKVYKELEESTKGFGEEIDGVLKKHNVRVPRDLSEFEIFQINQELSSIKVIENTEIHQLLAQLEEKTYK